MQPDHLELVFRVPLLTNGIFHRFFFDWFQFRINGKGVGRNHRSRTERMCRETLLTTNIISRDYSPLRWQRSESLFVQVVLILFVIPSLSSLGSQTPRCYLFVPLTRWLMKPQCLWQVMYRTFVFLWDLVSRY